MPQQTSFLKRLLTTLSQEQNVFLSFVVVFTACLYSPTDLDLVSAFLIGYRTFATPTELLDRLIQAYLATVTCFIVIIHHYCFLIVPLSTLQHLLRLSEILPEARR